MLKIVHYMFVTTLGSRGFFFLIDTEAALTQKKSGEEKKEIFFSSALCASLTRLRREPSVSIRKKYPLEPRVVCNVTAYNFAPTQRQNEENGNDSSMNST